MKTTTRISAVTTLGIVFSTAVYADPFNDRGPLPTFVATNSVSAPTPAPARPGVGFNQRGSDFSAEIPAGSSTPRPRVVATISGGFNDRSSGGGSTRSGRHDHGGTYLTYNHLND